MLGLSWGCLGLLGAILGHPWPILGHLGRILGPIVAKFCLTYFTNQIRKEKEKGKEKGRQNIGKAEQSESKAKVAEDAKTPSSCTRAGDNHGPMSLIRPYFGTILGPS